MPPTPKDMTLARSFGESVRACRLRRGWSLDRLAAEAGMSKTGVWEVEKGLSMPGIDTALKIATAMGLRVGMLIDADAEPRASKDAAIARKVAELYELTRNE